MSVKKRIIPLLTVVDNVLVKSIKFEKLINVGDPVNSAKIFNDSDADELILLNINRENRELNKFLKLLENISKNCFMPLSVGGGVNSLEDSRKLFNSGADKVVINSSIFKNINLVNEISETYGKQSIVVSLDFKKKDNEFKIFSECGKNEIKLEISQFIKKVEKIGVGEFFINSIDFDGTMSGLDLKLFKYFEQFSSTPIIGGGGAGNFYHLKDAFLNCNLSAVACGSLFNFGDNNPIRAKNYLSNFGLDFKLIDY